MSRYLYKPEDVEQELLDGQGCSETVENKLNVWLKLLQHEKYFVRNPLEGCLDATG